MKTITVHGMEIPVITRPDTLGKGAFITEPEGYRNILMPYLCGFGYTAEESERELKTQFNIFSKDLIQLHFGPESRVKQ